MQQPSDVVASHTDTADVSYGIELNRCLDALKYILRYRGPDHAKSLVHSLNGYLQSQGVSPQTMTQSPYINTLPSHYDSLYPGNLAHEERLGNLLRWNAMAMVVKANKENDGLGGHISTYASSATLYEVGFNHFYKGNQGNRKADQVYFQGHASPGNYARSFLEGRLSDAQLSHFRQELSPTGGLSSYPHPYLMPDYWQFPTVSMGLGPVMSIYQARFNKYLQNRNFLDHDPHVWCYIGDGECDEPETLGALSIAARESLDNLTFVINCNLQRLDGPVRGNSKIIQELESIFNGAGWNVIKVVWSSDWDPLLASEHRDLLIQRMNEVVDGEFQKYCVEPGSYMRKHFFGKYPELLALVESYTDDDLLKLRRGGHDPKKVYAAYHAAVSHKGKPSVILVKTVKGYGLGTAAEGKNISHQQKKLTEKELREYRNRFNIPISDDQVAEIPFYHPGQESPEIQYLQACRKKLGGYLPERIPSVVAPEFPGADFYAEFLGASANAMSTTMAFVRILSKMLRNTGIAKYIVPIIPDEGRTFGMEALFGQIGIYSPVGQLYEPVDAGSLMAYREATDGQILEEGINEVGAMSSWLAAGTAYATHGIPMIPFYIYYSMFGLQRVGDMMWLAGDIQAKGFLLGGTAGRTTLNGEGLQHQDGHSHLLASTIPNCRTYDVAFRYEVAVIIQDGLKRMYVDQENCFYYMTLGNENYAMPEMPAGAEKGIIEGLYKFSTGGKGTHKVHIFGSGTIMREAIRAQAMLADYGISADIWGATNYKNLRENAMRCDRWNRLNPAATPRKSYVETTLEKESGHFFAVSDNMQILPTQIQQWVPGGLTILGTDGFGRSDTREALRDFFEVSAPFVVVTVLDRLSKEGLIPRNTVEDAIKTYNINPEKASGLNDQKGSGHGY